MESNSVIEQLDEFELDKGEDAPMSIAAWPETKQLVCGINSSLESLKSSANQNCRKFVVEDQKCVPIADTQVTYSNQRTLG